MPWSPYHPGGHMKSALRKKTNIKDTCCINIKTKADKEEEGQEGKEDIRRKTCAVEDGKIYSIALYSTRVKRGKKD